MVFNHSFNFQYSLPDLSCEIMKIFIQQKYPLRVYFNHIQIKIVLTPYVLINLKPITAMSPQNEPPKTTPIPNDEEIQAFIIAIKSGSIDKMKEMLDEFRQNISNKLESQQRQPPLYFAAINSDEQLSFEMVKMLVEAGGNPNFKDANQQTIMFYACRDGKKSLVKYLLQNGGKLNQEDLYGQTPIYYAASEDRLELLDLFTPEMIKHVDRLAKQTPLYYAARKGHLQMCKKLVERGCDITHHDSNNKTAVQYAKKARFQDVSDYLASEIKKYKDLSKIQAQNVQQSSHTQNANSKQRRKKENVQLNMNKNTYKITVYKENGQLHDLSEEQVKQLFKNQPDLETYFANPDSIPIQYLENTLQDTWEKIATKIINQIWKPKSSYWFHEPVEPIKFGIIDYFDVITKPMDLGTVKKKLNYNVYNNAQQFVDDICLVWNNCYKYNGENHEISQCAKEVQKNFEDACNSLGFNRFL